MGILKSPKEILKPEAPDRKDEFKDSKWGRGARQRFDLAMSVKSNIGQSN
jgi:hypothetical protein